ncbi:hypothetical protein NPIL_538371 [Nephila pilipes]|uniref:Uncharacterized protein n=1 Tax=Nephila pilipes TaxID=299642 RepID=A0A8X6TSV3_NEPPI|nr:hypothetical protein NPIL_538371 [Nephila pilipes]
MRGGTISLERFNRKKYQIVFRPGKGVVKKRIFKKSEVKSLLSMTMKELTRAMSSPTFINDERSSDFKVTLTTVSRLKTKPWCEVEH